MIKEQILPLFILITTVYTAYRFHNWLQALPKEEEVKDYIRIYDRVHTLEEITKQIETLEEIITDLNACSSEAMKGIKLSVPSALKCNEYTVLTNGSDCSAEQLLNLAYSERRRKREELLQAIPELSPLMAQSLKSVNQETQRETQRE